MDQLPSEVFVLMQSEGGWKGRVENGRYKEGRVEIRRGGSAGVREGQKKRYVGKRVRVEYIKQIKWTK